MKAYCVKCNREEERKFFPNAFFCNKCLKEEDKKIEGKICPIHRIQLYYMRVHIESGGFVDDYLKCFERGCDYTEPLPKDCWKAW